MKFDYTDGKEAKYLVSVYSWNIHDCFYFGEYVAAKAFFKKLKEREYEPDTVISLYDMKKDVRKEYFRS